MSLEKDSSADEEWDYAEEEEFAGLVESSSGASFHI